MSEYECKNMNVDAVSQHLAAKFSNLDFEAVYRTGTSITDTDSLPRLTEPSHDDTA